LPEIVAQLAEIARKMEYSDAVWSLLDEARREGNVSSSRARKRLLDIDHGTYPFVTSSNTVAGKPLPVPGLAPPPSAMCWALPRHTTRVGSGHFPTEQDNDIGELIGRRGREFGTVTGRKRRCGWFDAVLVRQAIKTSGIHGIALTKLDVLDGLDEIKVSIGYMLDGRRIDRFPAAEEAQKQVVPVYESFEGWKDSTAGARSGPSFQRAIKYQVSRRTDRMPRSPLSTSGGNTILMDPFED
jgi:adenylosuccinate synthase